MNRISVAQLFSWSLGFVAVWFAAVVIHAVWRARDRRFDPLEAEPPHPLHHDHDDHHGDHHDDHHAAVKAPGAGHAHH